MYVCSEVYFCKSTTGNRVGEGENKRVDFALDGSETETDGKRFLFFDTVKAGNFRISGIPMEIVGGFVARPIGNDCRR